MSWDDFSRTLATFLEDRFSNPLITSFLMSWPVWNYKFLVILFSDNTVLDTFELIRMSAYPDVWGSPYWFTLVGPIATAYAYVYLLPRFSQPYFKKWRTNLQAFNGIKEQLPIEPVVSKAEALELEKKFFELDTTISQLRIENRALKHDLHLATNKVEDYESLKVTNEQLAERINNQSLSLTNCTADKGALAIRLSNTEQHLHALKVKYLTLTDFVAAKRSDALPALTVIEEITAGVDVSNYDGIPTRILDGYDIGMSLRNHSKRLVELERIRRSDSDV